MMKRATTVWVNPGAETLNNTTNTTTNKNNNKNNKIINN